MTFILDFPRDWGGCRYVVTNTEVTRQLLGSDGVWFDAPGVVGFDTVASALAQMGTDVRISLSVGATGVARQTMA
jgi:hypothetical protein